MITKISNIDNKPAFQANIIFNETLYKGLSRAKLRSRLWDRKTILYEKNEVNNFLESLDYLLKDGTKDVYEVKPGNTGYEPDARCYLYKNGEAVLYHDGDYTSLGDNVMKVFTKHVAFNDKNLNRKFNKLVTTRMKGFKLISKAIDKLIGNKHFGDMI